MLKERNGKGINAYYVQLRQKGRGNYKIVKKITIHTKNVNSNYKTKTKAIENRGDVNTKLKDSADSDFRALVGLMLWTAGVDQGRRLATGKNGGSGANGRADVRDKTTAVELGEIRDRRRGSN